MGFPALSDLILQCLAASPPHDLLLVDYRRLEDLTARTTLPNAGAEVDDSTL